MVLKNVIWRLQICNYFREIIKFWSFNDNKIFCEIINAFIKSLDLNISTLKRLVFYTKEAPQ